MQEYDLVINLVKNSNEAIIAIDLNGKVTLWNKGAERLFGHKEKDVLGKNIPFIKDKFNFELEAMLTKAKEDKPLSFKTTKETMDGKYIDLLINSNPILKNSIVVGVSAIIQEVNSLKKVCYLPFDEQPLHRESKRTFLEIRDIILLTLGSGKKTINQISSESGINWRTVEKHLTFLIGKKLVSEIFSSEYVRIFELTGHGVDYVGEIKDEELKKYIKIKK